jgi:hypothetical protein
VTVTARDCKEYLPRLAEQEDEPWAILRASDALRLPAGPRTGSHGHPGRRRERRGVRGYDDFARVLQVNDGRWRTVRRLPRLAREALYQFSRVSRAPAGRVDLLRRAARGEPLYWGLDVVFWESEKWQLLRPSIREQFQGRSAALVRGLYNEVLQRAPAILQQMSFVDGRTAS